MGRTVSRWLRAYVDALDMSGFTRTVGALGVTYTMAQDKVVGHANIGYLKNQPAINAGPLSVAFDTTEDVGPHEHFKGLDGGMRNFMAAIGELAEPKLGDVVFAAQLEQGSYVVQPSEESQVAYADMALKPSQRAVLAPLYEIPWGQLLHPKGSETGVNAALGTGNPYTGGATDFGGFMVYHLLSSDGALELQVEDAATNLDASFAELVGTGAIDASVAPVSGIVPLAKTATVREFTRWQLVLDTATTAQFVLAFIRDFS